VILQKAGDVIPDIVSVLTDLRTGKEKIFHYPKEIAGVGAIERIPGQAAYRAVNKNTFAQMKRQFYHFVGKDAFNIVHCGPKVVDQLLVNNLVTDFSDIFTLKKGDILTLPRWGEKSVDNLLQSIEERRKIELARFMVGLSIINVGTETAEDVANHFKTIERIMTASQEEFNKVPNIGVVVSESLYSWFRDLVNIQLVKNLLKQVEIKPVEEIKARNEKVYGKTFVLTGTLEKMERDEAKRIIKSLGGDVSSAVSKNTDFVVAGENPGSKYAKAQELGVVILSEGEFFKLIT
jgi:DNA ligase (NAD+)